jgi:hypothetical protein
MAKALFLWHFVKLRRSTDYIGDGAIGVLTFPIWKNAVLRPISGFVYLYKLDLNEKTIINVSHGMLEKLVSVVSVTCS